MAQPNVSLLFLQQSLFPIDPAKPGGVRAFRGSHPCPQMGTFDFNTLTAPGCSTENRNTTVQSCACVQSHSGQQQKYSQAAKCKGCRYSNQFLLPSGWSSPLLPSRRALSDWRGQEKAHRPCQESPWAEGHTDPAWRAPGLCAHLWEDSPHHHKDLIFSRLHFRRPSTLLYINICVAEKSVGFWNC